MEDLTFTLPLPPSLNNAYGNRGNGKGRYARRELTEWKRASKWLLKYQLQERGLKLPAPGDEPLIGKPRWGCSVHFSYRTQGDLDNRIKAVLDLFVSMRITSDDRYCRTCGFHDDVYLNGGTPEELYDENHSWISEGTIEVTVRNI